MEVDFGGVGKECAVDRAATICRESAVADGLINLRDSAPTLGAYALIKHECNALF